MKNFFNKLNDSVNLFYLIHFLIFALLSYLVVSIATKEQTEANTVSLCFFGFIFIIDIIAVLFIVLPNFYEYWFKNWYNDYLYNKTHSINTYTIKYNDFWKMFQVSHNEIGACIAEFKNFDEAKEYCEKG